MDRMNSERANSERVNSELTEQDEVMDTCRYCGEEGTRVPICAYAMPEGCTMNLEMAQDTRLFLCNVVIRQPNTNAFSNLVQSKRNQYYHIGCLIKQTVYPWAGCLTTVEDKQLQKDNAYVQNLHTRAKNGENVDYEIEQWVKWKDETSAERKDLRAKARVEKENFLSGANEDDYETPRGRTRGRARGRSQTPVGIRYGRYQQFIRHKNFFRHQRQDYSRSRSRSLTRTRNVGKGSRRW